MHPRKKKKAITRERQETGSRKYQVCKTLQDDAAQVDKTSSNKVQTDDAAIRHTCAT